MNHPNPRESIAENRHKLEQLTIFNESNKESECPKVKKETKIKIRFQSLAT